MVYAEQYVIRLMKQAEINFVATLPCDRIKNLLPPVLKSFDGIELTREENGLGICAGAYLAGARPMMIIQSTGLGNMINALESLNMASGIPIPILASYRGFYKEAIESQNSLGRHLPAILQGCGIPFTMIDEVEKLGLLSDVIQDVYANYRPHVALVSPKVWESSSCTTAWQENLLSSIKARPAMVIDQLSPILQPEMTRYEAILTLGGLIDGQVVVANLGVPSKELFAICDRPLNYYMLGSMGLVSSIGFGISRFTHGRVMVLEGDGSILMNPNALMTIGQYRPRNLMIIALDNACYGSTGSQRTYTQNGMDLELFARSCGIKNSVRVHKIQELRQAVHDFEEQEELSFIHVLLKPGNSPCPNIPLNPKDITKRFKNSLRNLSFLRAPSF